MERTDYIQLFDKFLQKQATTEEIQLLIRWLKDEGSFDTWLDEEWDAVSSEMNPVLQKKLFGQIREKIEIRTSKETIHATGRSRTLYSWINRIAAVLLLFVATGAAVYFYQESYRAVPDTIVAVEKGQKAKITLPDGSKVWINADTELSYGSHFNRKERVLHLKGEAYFEVASDKERPFIVMADDISVRALGTCFNVKAYTEEQLISTVLMSGQVEVKSDMDCLTLLPNERIIFNKATGQMAKSNVSDASDYSNWKDNTLSFNSETFESVAHVLERYYNIHIVFESESLKKYRFTGNPGNTSLESILQILSLTSPLSYEIKDSVIILRENTKQKVYYEKALQ